MASQASRGAEQRAGPLAASRIIAGRYRVEREIASGGAATVYRAFDTSTRQPVALKSLREVSDSDDSMALFEREYHTLRRLHHPTIVQVYDYGIDQERPYYTMELLEGQDLRQVAPLAYPEACRHLRDVASSLALLHARRLVHRDVSARNVIRTNAGRCKLLDFGGLAPFGVSLYIIGTPPFTAPEVLSGVALDHRVDLYALGALAYWLLTKTHAYPARDFGELLEYGRKRPLRPSQVVPGLPAALDDLVLALLSHNPLARPATAAEVIDRLNAIGGLEPEETVHVAQSYFASPALVGRDPELAVLREAVERARAGRGSVVVVEGSSGMGKTRLLTELAIEAQIASAVVVNVDAAMHRDALGVANAMAVRLLDVAPAEAAHAAVPHAGYLARLSPAVRHRLDATMRAPHGEEAGEWRGRIQEALQSWIAAVSSQRPVVLIVDNAQFADASSLALLRALGLEARQRPLLLVAAGAGASLALPARGHAEVLKLGALSSAETVELVRSLFGDVPHVTWLAERLQDASGGNPLGCVEAARHLVTTGGVRYAQGTWVVSHDTVRAPLAVGVEGVARQRILDLSPPALALAEALSLARGPIRIAVCTLVAREVGLGSPFDTLDELVAEGVLLGHGDDYRFAQDSLRQALLDQLNPALRRALHRCIAEWLLTKPDPTARIEAGWHLLHAGEESRGAELLAKQAATLRSLNVFEGDVRSTTAAIEAALAVYRKQKRSMYELAPLLFALTVCGYFFDRTLAARYGDETAELLARASGLALARKLRPFLGGALAVVTALGIARVRFALRRRRDVGYDFGLLITYLLGSVCVLCAVSALCLDTAGAARAARVLEPFGALSRRRTTPHLHRYCQLLTATTQESFARARRGWLELASIFEDPKEVRLLSDEARRSFLGGIWNALGILECLRGGPAALEYAKRLETLGVKVYEMVGAQIRAMYHTLRGEIALADSWTDKVELHAIQMGSAWQIEVWWPVSELRLHQVVPDVVRLKQSLEQIERLAGEIPSLYRYALLTRAAYLRAHGDLEGALALDEQVLANATPRSFLGWTSVVGEVAALYNSRGDYASAQLIAAQALSQYTGDDRDFIVITLVAEVEWAVATAALGGCEEAAQRLDALLDYFGTTENPLVLGTLHHGRARVALLAGDRDTYADQLMRTRRWFERTENPALIAFVETLAQRGRGSTDDMNPPPSAAAGGETVRVRR